MITEYHAKYYALELNRIGGTGVDRIGRALFDACVDLNPHQIDAALFAMRSPLSKGVLLADEVGLGKTIEAGLILCQCWAEKKRHLLVIVPASLRKQWALELGEKFALPTAVLDSKTYKDLQKSNITEPFNEPSIIICSMHFAASHTEDIKKVPWDLVVIDEAHKLRNSYRQSNRIGQRIRWETEDFKKLLLTATPLQNSLLELYGLSSIIDEHLFGDLSSFKTRYINYGGDLKELRERLKSFCWRTLRSQVTEFVRYTERKSVTRKFIPSEQEQTLYESVSSYLQRDDNYALPSGQKHLLTLLVRKVLASSPHAVAGTLCVMLERLKKIREQASKNLNLVDKLLTEDEIDDDLIDELLQDDEDVIQDEELRTVKKESSENKIDLKKLEAEIRELEDYIRWARSIGTDTKAKTLLKALEIGFKELKKMGAERKTVIFTESRRTQSWLKDYLEANGYLGQVLTFNGTNKDDSTGKIYQEWFEKNRESGRASGSKQIDLRTAIIDCFKDKSSILIATEAGAEGLNLQFCSMVVNFDLPWNPQRIEQRIGRCHRYGQKHDVVVINFLNEKNAADCRVYELLEKKFNLFSGVFGASDDILGTIESGVDFERRVLEICQQCRTEKEIEDAFSRLQSDLEEKIKNRMNDTRRILLEHFDEDVHDRLKTNLSGTQEKIDRISRMFWHLTKQVLASSGRFDDVNFSFMLDSSPAEEISTGNYSLISKEKENIPGRFLYRLSHPLGEYVLKKAISYKCPTAEITFDISHHATKISLVENLVGKSGWLELRNLRIDSFGSDEYLLFSAFDDSGQNIDQETCEKLFLCPGSIRILSDIPAESEKRLKTDCERHVNATVSRNLEENNKHFSEARDQLDKWAEDMEVAAQKELEDVKRQIKESQRRSRLAPTMEEQHTIQEEISMLERKKRSLRENIFNIEDEISEKRDRLVASLEKRMKQKTVVSPVFTVRWSVV